MREREEQEKMVWKEIQAGQKGLTLLGRNVQERKICKMGGIHSNLLLVIFLFAKGQNPD